MNSFEGSNIERSPGVVIPEADDVRRTNNLFQAIERSVLKPEIRRTINDPVELALLEASLPEFLEPTGRLRPHIDEVFAWQRLRQKYYPNHYAFRKHELAIDNQMARIFGDDYPSKFSTYDAWRRKDAFGQFDYEQYVLDMQRNQAYNYPQAYEIFHLESQIFRDRWGRAPIVLDIGYASGQGDVKWAVSGSHPFKQIKLLKSPRPGKPIENLAPDEEAQEIASALSRNEPVIGGITGIDIEPIAPDRPSQEWAINNTFPMSQKDRGSTEYQEFETIQRVISEKGAHEQLRHDHNVHLIKYWIDATDPESLEILKYVLPGGKADLIILSGVIMQLPQEKIANLLRNIQDYSSDGAIISVCEWAVADPKQPSRLRPINENWWHRPGAFANFLINPHKLDAAPIHLGSFTSRRGEEMMLTPKGRKLLMGEESLESLNF